MGAWAFQEVLNVGIQIVLLVFTGWCFARFGLLKGEHFMGQINVLLLRVAFPVLNIYLLGIKVDLRDAEAWRSLGAYMLWVTLTQVGIVVYVWSCRGHAIGDAGLLNLVLTANNTVIVGLPVMEATFPSMGSRLSLLTAFVLFLQVIPFSITAFEVEKWMVEDHHRRAAAAATVSEPPSTPDRELSGRWVAGEPQRPMGSGWEDVSVLEGCRRGSDFSHKDQRLILGNGGTAAAMAAAESRTPRGSCDAGDGTSAASGGGARRCPKSLAKSSSGSSSASAGGGGGGGGGSSNRAHARVRSRLGRRRVGNGVVVGTMARGWAPATPLDSPSVSVHGVGQEAAATAVPLPPPAPPPPRECGDAVGPIRDLQREFTLRPRASAAAVAVAVPAGPWGQQPGVSEAPMHVDLQGEGDLDLGLNADLLISLELSNRLRGGGLQQLELQQQQTLSGIVAAAGGSGAEATTSVEGDADAVTGVAGAAAAVAGPARAAAVISDPQPVLQLTPGSAAMACLDRTASAPCPDIGRGSLGVSGLADAVRAADVGCEYGATGAPVATLPSAGPLNPSTFSSSTDGGGGAAAAPAPAFEFRPVSVAAAAAGAAASGIQVKPQLPLPPPPPSPGLRTALTARLTTPPSSALPTPAPALKQLAPSGRREAASAASPTLRPRRHSNRRIPNGRVSADNCGVTAAVARPMVHHRQSNPGHGGGGLDSDDFHRRSLPVHWPPAGVEAGTAPTAARAPAMAMALAAAPASVAPLPPPSPPPPLSRRLLNPLAVACPDLPVPQAIYLARAPTSGVTDGRLSCSSIGLRRPSCDLTGAIGVGIGDDTSTRPTAGRPVPAGAGTLGTVSMSVSAAEAAAAAADAATAADAAEEESQPQPAAPPDRALVRAAASSMTRRHGGVMPAVGLWLKLRFQQYNRAWSITIVILKNPLLWSLLVALVINLSGLRSVLWPGSSHYRPELGWVAGTLSWTSAITVPVSLFSNGVWLYGKTFGRPTLLRAGGLLLLKLLVLGPLQLACAAACGMEADAAMSLLLLALCPVASTSFVIASQYGHGADLVTAMTMLGIVLLVPVVLVALALPRALGLYEYQVSSSAVTAST